jgi:hypothetical protein
MSTADKTLHVCSCNGTMPLDAAALARALDLAGPLPLHTELCQKELARFADHAEGDLLVACTQEARPAGDLAEDRARRRRSLRQHSRPPDGRPKRALRRPRSRRCWRGGAPRAAPVPRVVFSEGRLLIVGPADGRTGPRR